MDKAAEIKRLWLCDGRACPAGTLHCAVQDPGHWPNGCRHTFKKDFARYPENPNPFKLFYGTNALYLIEQPEEK